MISIRINGENYYPTTISFPGGEVHVTIPDHLPGPSNYIIKTKLKSPKDIMELLLVKDAMDIKYGSVESILRIPYVPYARQDRVCNSGESLSIKVMARLINSMNFNSVITFDNHSDVATALIDNCKDQPAYELMGRSSEITSLLTKTNICLCSPDAGANKKTLDIAKHFNGVPIIRADKVRDSKSGKILKTEVYCDDLKGISVMIADDICDGGMTFIKLAEALKEKGAGKLFLYVTHGIFSKGLEPLSMYQKIYTTDSLKSVEESTKQLSVIKI